MTTLLIWEVNDKAHLGHESIHINLFSHENMKCMKQTSWYKYLANLE